MHIWFMNNGRWQLDLMTSRRNDVRLREAIIEVTGDQWLRACYETQAEAEAVKREIMAHV
jgi:hypothetical protein